MGCRMFGAKPLSEPMLDYCQVVEQISVKLESNTIFSQENARGYDMAWLVSPPDSYVGVLFGYAFHILQ